MSIATAVRDRSITAADLRFMLVLALAAIIAWFQPFDLAFDAATFGVAPLRSATIVGLALAGAAIGRRAGLAVEAPPGRPWAVTLAAAGAVAVLCAVSDWVWRPALHPGYVAFLTQTPLATRIIIYAVRALNESIIYRLFLVSLLVWIIGAAWKGRDGRPAPGAFWSAIVLSQATNIWFNSTSLAPLTPMALAHDAFRYVAPGTVWGWLYWRRGFEANEVACTSVHLLLQPLLQLGL